MFDHLFSEGTIGTMKTNNRIVFTAMGNAFANTDGTVSETDIAFYGARAKGGVGLVITECAVVDGETGRGNGQQICVYDDKFVPGLKALSDEIHKYDQKLAVQIYHPGRQGVTAFNGNGTMPAPSAIECKAVHQPTHAMSLDEIKAMVQKFVAAAVRVKEAGVDAVEVHGAHGYLINEFLSPYTNVRTDEYGGSTENRMRFLEEIITGIQEKCGKDYPMLVRLSVDEFLEYSGVEDQGLKLEESVKIAKRLEELGVHALDISSGIYESMNTAWEPSSFPQGWKIHLAETIKKAVQIPVIGVSVIRDPEYADQIIKEGKLDFAGSARQHYSEPEWSNKAKEGRLSEIRKCISCLHCMETLMGMGGAPTTECTINIQTGKEHVYTDIKKDGANRKVAIIGAGPAGLEAARVLLERGFQPVIFEKNKQLGGQLQLANKPPKKEKINWLIQFLQATTEEKGVEIRYGHAATLEELKKLDPYAIFITQGSKPFVPKFLANTGLDSIVTAADVLGGTLDIQEKNVAIVGSGLTGLETAHYLAERKNKVHLFEMEENIGPGLFFQNLIDVMNHIMPLGVELHPNSKLIDVREGQATFEHTVTGACSTFDFDCLVLSIGNQPATDLVEEINKEFDNVRILGDANKVGKIRDAMEDGFLAAYELS
ncbi:FAD-dependent oxidoreductase [Alkalibacter rhizosphaerae]|uniref:FAD-dependent oxidoreductase n=1 Tax=Alkalibacter rhizosphaerae TaxID=2815577 RepID=A0A974XEK5_9FIRM|nr:FAD-dependent oxidoreductase [Alkalibacter rhizosphaerae]QSX08414.1 FAD-dependent oxidoreductase [Alkalibacter rhizosphaerae]